MTTPPTDESLYVRKWYPQVVSWHTIDLIIIQAVLLAITLLLAILIWTIGSSPSTPVAAQTLSHGVPPNNLVIQNPLIGTDPRGAARISALAALIAAWAAASIAIYNRMITRLGVIDIVSFEIIAICRVISSADLTKDFINLYETLKPRGFGDTARAEEYFENFHRLGKEVGDIHRYDIARITEFYTYLKGSRDATGSIAHWFDKDGNQNPDYDEKRKKDDVLSVLYLLFLCFEAACYAICSLRSKSDLEFFAAILYKDLDALYKFLAKNVDLEDPRKQYLAMPRRKNLMSAESIESFVKILIEQRDGNSKSMIT